MERTEMAKMIKYRDGEETVYLNVASISEARWNPSEGHLEVTIGDPGGECQSRYLRGEEARKALRVLNEVVEASEGE
jgi:hypothetical protein